MNLHLYVPFIRFGKQICKLTVRICTAVGDKTPKQSRVKGFQFASKFVGYNHFASALRVKDAYFEVQLHLHYISIYQISE